MGLRTALHRNAICLLLLLALSTSLQAQQIASDLRKAASVEVEGSTSPRLALSRDLGLVAPELTLPNLSIRFARTPRQQQELDRLLLAQQDPRAPEYHHWLRPEEFQARFGISRQTTTQVMAWLAGQGFTHISESRGGSYIRFQGSAAQAQTAFGVRLHQLTWRGERHFANVTNPSLPKELAAVTTAITGLDDFRPIPHHVRGSARLATIDTQAERPLYTDGTGTHYLAPDDFHTIYDETVLLKNGKDGSGVTVAVVGQSDIDLSDIAAFRTAAGLAANAPSVVIFGSDPGVPSNDDLLESELAVEWAGATAPGATILYVNSTSVLDGSLTEAVDKNLAPIISISYGDCEPDLGASTLAYYSLLLQQAAAQGITIVAAAGDAGATDCDARVASATHGLTVDFPASSPVVTGVGGTSFDDSGSVYFSAANNAQGGSALSYIPEAVWNDDALGGIAAGGGGRSAYFAKPAWQAGAGVPNDFSRDVPDVALNASPNHDPYLICTAGHCTNGFANAAGDVEYAGGTSFGAPAFAGLLALVEQTTGSRIGNANTVLYALASSSFGPTVFHDVTAGTNASPCDEGTTDCATASIGYTAGSGYDLASGLGSVDAYALVNDWPLVVPVQPVTGPLPTMTNITGTANNVSAGTPITFVVSVVSGSAGSAAVPTGNIQFTVDDVPVGGSVALAGGTASQTIDTTQFAVGTRVVRAVYLGDAVFMGSKGAFSVSITSTNAPDFSFTPASATVSVASGQVGQGLELTATSLNGFSGLVQLTASAPAALNVEYSFSTDPIDLTGATRGSSTLILFAYKGAPQSRRGSHLSLSSLRPLSVALGLTGLCWLAPFRRRRRFVHLLVLVFAFASLQLAGCASGSMPSAENTPAPPGSYPVLITASSTVNGVSVVHSSTVTLIVQ